MVVVIMMVVMMAVRSSVRSGWRDLSDNLLLFDVGLSNSTAWG